MRWKGFTAEHDTWEKEKDLEHAKEALERFKERMNVEVRRQEKLDMVEKKNFRREELSEKYMAKMLYGWDDGKFEEVREELVKIKVSFSGGETLKKGNVKNKKSRIKSVDLVFSYFHIFLIFFLIYFHIFLFRELRVRVSYVTQEERHKRH